MKMYLAIIAFLSLSFLGYSQGIQFEQGTWAQVLAKAKETNKPIFVDIYTTWCGPCRTMSNEIFPLAAVGKEFNTNFVCYKIDAEKGEGIQLAKLYEVNAYPTYLFVKGDGTLIMRSLGSMSADEFIAVSQSVMDEMNSPKPYSVWEKEYTLQKSDPEFLLAYMKKRAQLGKSNAALLDEYLALLPSDKRMSKEIVDLYDQESSYLKIGSLAYKNLWENARLFYPIMGESMNEYISGVVDNSLREAARGKNEQLLQQVIDENEKLSTTSASRQKEELYMNYYRRTNNVDNYVTNATIYCDDLLKTIASDVLSLEKRDKYSRSLNEVAWNFFEKVTDVKALENALRWSKRALELSPDKPMLIDTYANLLYKLGRKDDAVVNESKALAMAKKDKADIKGYEETLLKMKSGEKTWK